MSAWKALVVFLFLSLGPASFLSIGAVRDSEVSFASLERLLADRSGDLSLGGTLTTFSHGTATTSAITGYDFLEAAKRLFGPPAVNDIAVPNSFGTGIDNPTLAQALGWQRCDYTEVAMLLSTYEDGIIQIVPSETDGIHEDAPPCQGRFGNLDRYADVSIDIRNDSPRSACAFVEIPVVGPSTSCGWTQACISGDAAISIFSFFTETFVWIAGGTSSVATGNFVPGTSDAPCLPGITPV